MAVYSSFTGATKAIIGDEVGNVIYLTQMAGSARPEEILKVPGLDISHAAAESEDTSDV